MEKLEATEELRFLGTFGIVIEAFTILLHSSRRKLLWALALTLLLPLSFASLGHQNLIFGPLLLKINQKTMEAAIHPGGTARRELASEWRELLLVLAAYIAFVVTFSLLSTAAVVYTVASIYSASTKKLKLSYGRVLSADVPRVWKRLMSTFLWYFIISLGFMVASLLAIYLLIIIFLPAMLSPPVGGKVAYELDLPSTIFVGVLTIVVFLCPQIYITMVWYLASVVSVLEDKYYGLAAIWKSSNLIKGKRMTMLVLLILSSIFSGIIGWVFRYAVANGRIHGVGLAARVVNGTILLGLFCFGNLIVLLTQSVLYFVCKSYHHESIDDNLSFKVDNVGDYEPLEISTILLEDMHAEV